MVNILQDTYGRVHSYLRISLVEKCNLRCTYCMPADGVELSPKSNLMTTNEVIELATLFVQKGVTKIRLTGGEPLLRKDLPEILKGLHQLPVELSLTTNAILVDRFIEDFKKYGIKNINVSLDTLNAQKFEQITKRNQFERAYQNIMLLIEYGFNVKLNVVLMKGENDNEIIDFIHLTKAKELVVRFIEFMPFNGNRWNKTKLVSQHEIEEKVNRHYGATQVEPLEEEAHFTARNYQIKGHLGSYGIISSVSNPFCGTCNRIRLTANGKIKNCLFSGEETDLLEAYRRGEPVDVIIQKSILQKKAIRAGMDQLEKLENPSLRVKNRSMITIGG